MASKRARILSLLLVACMLISMLPVSAIMAGGIDLVETTDKGMTGDDYNRVVSQKYYSVIPGVKETDIVLNDETGTNQNMCYVMEVDLTGEDSFAAVMPSYKDMNPSEDNWGTQVMSQQAAAAEAMGYNVVGGINVSLSWASDEPMGMLVINGVVYHNSVHSGSYLVVHEDGTAELRDGKVPLNGDEWQAITVNFGWLVKNGQKVYTTPDHTTANRAPRTCIGIKEDGSLVLFVVDGRQAPTSVGMTMYELSQAMYDLGCVQAVNCDGGGSTTFLTEREGTGELTVKNSPSDGVERPTLGGLLVLSTAKNPGEFDHAAIFPGNDIYTPGTEIEFIATGVDSGGLVVDLPEDLTWALADNCEELGEIDSETGVFTASEDNEGIVTVQLKDSEGEVVGSSTIEIAKPDEIYFPTDEISIGFESSTDFNIVVRNKEREINYKDGDLIWTLSDENLGTFEGNIFTSSDGESLSGTVTVKSKFDENITASIKLIVGMLPTIVMDFEDYIDSETGEVIDAKDYYTIDEDGSIYYTSNYGRGGVQSAEIVSIDDNEPVRFGSHSLKLNYDFTACGAVTEGACFGMNTKTEIPGMPTGIGVWVYAPEGVGIEWGGDGTNAGFWLRGYVTDGAGGNQAYDFTFEPKVFTGDPSGWPDEMPGIYWEGWKYCEADLTKFTGPFSIQRGMTFRLMYVYGTKMGTKTAGSIYLDNLQFVYGANVDDTDNPVINKIAIEVEGSPDGIDLENGYVIDTNTVSFRTDTYDVQNKYTSGIDTVRMYIDGINTYDNDDFNYVVDPSGERAYLYNVELTNGLHALTVTVRDKFGNETTETRYFIIAGEGIDVPTISVDTKQEMAVLGQSVDIEINATDASSIIENTTEIKLGTLFTQYTVEFSENYDGQVTYNSFTKSITIHATRKEGLRNEGAGNRIATVKVQIPTTLNANSVFSYTVKSGIYTVSAGEGGEERVYTYSTRERTLPIAAMYIVSADPIIVGSLGTIHVENADGTPASGISLYLQGTGNGILIGTTDANGDLQTDRFSTTAGTYVVYAKDANDNVSFTCNVSSFAPQCNANGTPEHVLNNAIDDPAAKKSLSWFSSPLSTASQVLMYAEEGSDQWTTITAEQSLRTFTKSGNKAAIVNRVIIDNLKPRTTYQYKVGCDGNMSEVMTFTTNAVGADVNFFAFGDIQADDFTNIQAIINQIKTGSYDFGLQTGDAVDDATGYQEWMEVVSLFDVNGIGNIDMIHVLGNHEYAGDANGENAATIYNHPEAYMGSHYSVTYGNVYVAVINYTGNRGQLVDALEWLKQDIAKSNATWKVLSLHQPAYYTNITGGNAEINELVPPVADELGIDFVFSGHDHSYARTKPLTGGEVDEENGVVYFICGSSGEKSYSVTNNPAFHFEMATQDYNAIYISVSADYDRFSVTTYNVLSDGTVEIFDTYTKEFPGCENGEHSYMYDRDTGMLNCPECGHRANASSILYSGWANDTATNKLMYFVGGTSQIGYQFISSQAYYFDNDALAYDGDYTLCGEICHFEDGQFVSSSTADLLNAGLCGPTSEFILYSNGMFKVGGTGEMYNHALYGTVAWREQCPSIHSIVIGAGITSIGTYSFRGAYNCTSVTFEEGSNLKKISSYAFQNLNKMTEIVLPDGISTIMANAFIYCTSLRSVYMPESVLSIHAKAFDQCPNICLNVASDSYSEMWAINNHVNYIVRDPAALYVFYEGECGQGLTWQLTSDLTLTISGNGKMTAYAKAVDVPWYEYRESVKHIVVGSGVTELGNFAFYGCVNAVDVVFEEDSALTRLNQYAFARCSSLTDVVLPQNVTRLDYAAFQCNYALETLFMPAGINNINFAAFADTNKVTLNVLEGSYAHEWAQENNVKFVTRAMNPDDVLQEGTLSNGFTWQITYDGTLTVTGSGAMPDMANAYAAPWYEHRGLVTRIFIDKNITSLGNFAFYGLNRVTSVEFEEGSALTRIFQYAFARCSSLDNVVLPEGVTRIDYAAFQCNFVLTNLYLPIGVSNINAKAFMDTTDIVLSVFENSYAHNWAITNNVQYTLRTIDPETVLYSGECGNAITWVITYGGTLRITGCGALPHMENAYSAPWYPYRACVRRIEIDKDITSIGNFAFYGLSNAESVDFGEDSAVTRLFQYAFARCSSLTEVYLPDSLTRLDYASFQCNFALTSLYMPVGVNNIHDSAFMDTENVVLLVFEGSYSHTWAVEHNVQYQIREIDPTEVIYSGSIGSSIQWTIDYGGTLSVTGNGSIPAMANAYSAPWYQYRSLVKKIFVGKDITTIGDFAFYGLAEAESLEFEAGSRLTRLFQYAFARCSKVTAIVLPDTVTRIEYAAFQCNFALRTFFMPDGVNNINVKAFMDTTEVTLSVLEGSYAQQFAMANGIKYETRPLPAD